MATPNSVDSLIDYSFRRLGHPVVDINVDRQQAEERVDDALDFFGDLNVVAGNHHPHGVPGDHLFGKRRA